MIRTSFNENWTIGPKTGFFGKSGGKDSAQERYFAS